MSTPDPFPSSAWHAFSAAAAAASSGSGGLSKASATASYLGVLRRRILYIAAIVPLVFGTAVYLAFALPSLFRSTATILLEASSVNKDVVATTVVGISNDQIELVSGRVLTLETLRDLVAAYDPYPHDRQLSIEKKAQRVLENTSIERVDPVTLKPQEESNAFSLHYDNPDPERAAAVAARLAQLFLNYDQRTRTQTAKEAETFLASQAADVTRRLRTMDEQLKQFKNLHGDSLPEDEQRNEGEIDRAQHDLDAVQQEVLQTEEKESMLAVQLSQTSPNMITQTGDLTDIATVRANLAEAEQRYTPDHPEVKRLKQALETLMAQTRAGTDGIVSGANNPQYLATATELKAARRQLASLRTEAERLRGQVGRYEELLRRTPGVEREYSEIMRQRESLQTAYQQIEEKLRNAQLAERFETEQQGERFTLLRAPFPAKSPAYPNRLGLVMLGLILAIALAAVAVAIAESVDSAIRSAADFPQNPDTPLLASIPRIPNSRDVARSRLAFASWIVVYAAGALLVGVKILSALHAHG